jgi:hypothetical protein
MKSYFGIIEIGEIKNEQTASSEKKETNAVFIPLKENNIRFVHYSDCQQLTIWLTHPGREYGNVRLMIIKSKKVVEEWPVSDKLSGSIQILWDTLNIAPGQYNIEIDWKNGGQHFITIEKFEEGIVIKKEQLGTTVVDLDSPPIQYRDGFGNLLENEDLILREKVNKDITRRFFRHIEYEDNFRSGTIIYIDDEIRIEFYHEMGGGNCMFYIDIPTEEKWEAQTKTPLSSRKEILEFVATTVQRQQASNCNYEIKGNGIGFYYKEENRR